MKWVLKNNSGSYSVWQCLCMLPCCMRRKHSVYQIVPRSSEWMCPVVRSVVLCQIGSNTDHNAVSQSKENNWRVILPTFIWFSNSANTLSLLRKCDIGRPLFWVLKLSSYGKSIAFYFSLCLKLAIGYSYSRRSHKRGT